MLSAHYVVDLYWQVFLVLLCCSIVPPVFSCSVIPWYSDCSASVLFALQIIYILKEITFIYILLICCNIYCCIHQLTIYEKEQECINFLFYDCHLVCVLEIVCNTSTSITNFAVFPLFSTLLNKENSATQSKVLFESNY